MNFEDIEAYLRTHHRGVVSTRRPDGAAHVSIVVCGAYKGNAAFVSVYPKSQKIANLRRNSECTIMSVADDWWSFAVIEGKARLFDFDNTGKEQMETLLKEVYMSCSETEHSDWQEYQEAMVKQKAVVVLVPPERVYGRFDIVSSGRGKI